jgi:hypothetical protein
MSDFDPATVRRAGMEFTPPSQRFQELAPTREFIVELRQNRASYRAMAELLTQHRLTTGKTAISSFRHEVLGESLAHSAKPPGRAYRRHLTNGHCDSTQLLPKALLSQVETPPDRGLRIRASKTQPSHCADANAQR